MGDVTNLDARRESKKTTLEKIEAVFDWSLREVATLLGVSRGTVRSMSQANGTDSVVVG